MSGSQLSIAERFAALWPSAANPPQPDRALSQQLSELLRRSAEAWPSIQLPADALLAYWAEALAARGQAEPELAQLRVEEMHLTLACARGDPRATAALEEQYFAQLDAALMRVTADDDQRAEVKQQLRLRLLVAGEGQRPRIADYSGRGDLLGWLRVAAIRTALNLHRAVRRELPLDDMAAALPAAGSDPELEHLRETYREECQDALATAFRNLNRDQRNLLRQHYLDGLQIRELGALYHMHRVTAGRRLREARAALETGFRHCLSERLRVSAPMLQSILRAASPELDTSLRQLFKSRPQT